MQPFHVLNIQWLQPMPSWGNEVQAGMHSGVRQRDPVDSGLCIQECLVLWLHVADDRIPALGIVNSITKARRVNNGQSQVDALFFQQNLVCVNLKRFSL